MMTLLLQLNGDLPEKFPGHERKLYIFSCRRKACRKKEGTIRAIRGIRVSKASAGKQKTAANGTAPPEKSKPEPATLGLGNSLFNSTFTTTANPNQNPFSSPTPLNSHPATPFPSSFNSNTSPSSSLASKPPQQPSPDLPTTFAQKARISSPPPPPKIGDTRSVHLNDRSRDRVGQGNVWPSPGSRGNGGALQAAIRKCREGRAR